MRLIQPEYYARFRCLAAACPDSCCQGWDVEVDAASAARYRDLSGPLGDALRRAMYPESGSVWLRPVQGRCPMWRADGLCELQCRHGEAALCEVCRTYPRLRHDYGSFVELDLSMSCPEAARLILTAPPQPPTVQEVPGGEAGDYDMQDMALLLRTRETARALLTRPDTTPGEALALLLLYGTQVNAVLDGVELPEFDPAAALARARRAAEPGDFSQILSVFLGLELLNPQWRQRLMHPAGGNAWPEPLRRLALYEVNRLWLQAVSDGDLIDRVKLVCTECLLVRALGGDPIRTSQLYAKEIDNDSDNTDALLDAMYAHPAFTGSRLLGLLL